MGDPLSIAASVAGLVSLTAQIGQKASALYSAVKDAPKSISQVHDEVDEMTTVLCEVRSLLSGTKKAAGKSCINMISVNQLRATLSGCVLLCSKLDKKLGEVAGLFDGSATVNLSNGTAQSSVSKGNLLPKRIQWALWTKDEVDEILEDLRRHKESLKIMLLLVNCTQGAQANESLAKLHDLYTQIVDSNHDISRQLRELIKRQDEGGSGPTPVSLVPSNSQECGAASSTSSGTTSADNTLSTKSDIEGGRASMSNGNEDGASIRTTASIFSFTNELMNSRVYKRLNLFRWRSSSHSTASLGTFTSSMVGDSWSMLSDMSLGELSISEISVLQLPVCLSDLHDAAPYALALEAQNSSSVGEGPLRFKWTSRTGRLQKAIIRNDVFMVRMLLNSRIDIEELDTNYRTPLYCAIQSGNVEICKLLLDRGGAVNLSDTSGRTPLSYAAEKAYSDICVLFLNRGAEVNSADSSGRTPLSYASEMAYDNICTLLLDRGAAVDSADSFGRTPLSYAPEGEDPLIHRILSKKVQGADINLIHISGRTLLPHAARLGFTSLCKRWIDSGVAVDFLDPSGRTPLSYGAENGCVETCKLLIDRGAAVDSGDSFGRTPLSYAAEEAYSDICSLLLGRGAAVDSTDPSGRTPLSYAAEKADRGISSLLLDRGAVVDSPDSFGRTTLSYAAENAKYGICSLLLIRGAAVDPADSLGRTPLSYAAEKAIYNICALLLDRSSAVDSPDSSGRTPLSYAAEKANHEVCELLLDRGANDGVTDSSGRTPKMYVTERISNLSSESAYQWSQLFSIPIA